MTFTFSHSIDAGTKTDIEILCDNECNLKNMLDVITSFIVKHINAHIMTVPSSDIKNIINTIKNLSKENETMGSMSEDSVIFKIRREFIDSIHVGDMITLEDIYIARCIKGGKYLYFLTTNSIREIIPKRIVHKRYIQERSRQRVISSDTTHYMDVLETENGSYVNIRYEHNFMLEDLDLKDVKLIDILNCVEIYCKVKSIIPSHNKVLIEYETGPEFTNDFTNLCEEEYNINRCDI